MSTLESLRKALIPKPIRTFLNEKYLDYLFTRGIDRVGLFAKGEVDNMDMLPDIIKGWNNKEWSALGEFAEACMRFSREVKGPILECGSGLTTIIMGKIAQEQGNEVWALEHHEEWAKKVRRYLEKQQIHSVNICVQPLKDYGDFIWYNPPVADMPNNFSLVACDGPPGDLKGGRFGLVPVMKEKFSSDCIILLDDVDRAKELEVADRWKELLQQEYTVIGQEKAYAVFNQQ